jgi:hypothetical protein
VDHHGSGRGRSSQRSDDVTGDAGTSHACDDDCTGPVLVAQPIEAGVDGSGAGAANLGRGRRDSAQHLPRVDCGNRLDIVETVVIDADGHGAEGSAGALAASGLRASSMRRTGMSSRTG